jgi:hypothetical protein
MAFSILRVYRNVSEIADRRQLTISLTLRRRMSSLAKLFVEGTCHQDLPYMLQIDCDDSDSPHFGIPKTVTAPQ